MSQNLSRKDFFRQMGQETVRLVFQLWPTQPSSEPSPPILSDPLLSDLPPMLLVEEAQRLGLDPQGDPEVLARAIRQRMQRQAG
ncbi:MAG: hypothetical protein R6V21_08050 [Pelovirga sp.]